MLSLVYFYLLEIELGNYHQRDQLIDLPPKQPEENVVNEQLYLHFADLLHERVLYMLDNFKMLDTSQQLLELRELHALYKVFVHTGRPSQSQAGPPLPVVQLHLPVRLLQGHLRGHRTEGALRPATPAEQHAVRGDELSAAGESVQPLPAAVLIGGASERRGVQHVPAGCRLHDQLLIRLTCIT